MPLRSYTCQTHGETLLLLPAEYPPTTPCQTCQNPASYTLGAPARGIVIGSAFPVRSTATVHEGFVTEYESPTMVMRVKGTGLERADFICESGHEFGDDYVSVPVTPECPTCSAPGKRTVSGLPSADWFTKEHPNGYDDPSLGIHIESRAHLNRVLAERGLVAVSPDEVQRNIADHTAREEAKARHDEDEVRKMLHEYTHGADAAEMHRVAESDPGLDWRVYAKALGVE